MAQARCPKSDSDIGAKSSCDAAHRLLILQTVLHSRPRAFARLLIRHFCSVIDLQRRLCVTSVFSGLAMMTLASASSADVAPVVVSTISGGEWPARVVAYRDNSLLITAPDGWQCQVSFEQIDWEATARRNGGALDLLGIGDDPTPAPVCGDAGDRLDGPDGARTDLDSTHSPVHVPLIGMNDRPVVTPERYRAIAVRVSPPPIVDGILQDAVWRNAIPFTGFFQRERHEGEPATERTEVRIVYDSDSLYIGVDCFDSSPRSITSRNMIRDGELGSDDSITVLLDPLHDHRAAYLFGTNPNGMRVDSYLLGDTDKDLDTNWNGVWYVAARKNADGWTAEFRIPLSTLRFRRDEAQTWGLAFRRRIARRNEASYWPFIPNNSTFYRPAQAGHLDGLRGIHPGSNFRIAPYVALGSNDDFTGSQQDRMREIGVDARYWPTSTFAVDLSVNTDFAQTEVDDLQINLTRFPLYYPEKRQFFLEGNRVFAFGTDELAVFFSRRVGLADDRRPVPIVAAGRTVGKLGRYYVGALAVRTGEQEGAPEADSFVVRASRDVFSRSRIGAIVEERRTADGTQNRVVGLDVNLYRGTALSFNAFAVKVFDPRLTAGTFAARTGFGWNKDLWGATLTFVDIGDNFKPELGFVPRPGMFCYVGTTRYSPRPSLPWIRRLYVEPNFAYHPTQQGVLWTRARGASFRVELETGDNVIVRHDDSYERLFKPFPIRANQPIPVGSYSFGRHGVELTTFQGRGVQASARWNTGAFYDGERTDVEARAVVRLSSHVSAAPGISRSTISLPGGVFTATIASSRFTYTVTPNLSMNTLMQWTSEGRTFVGNVRVNYILKPGADFYLVYTEADVTAERWLPRNRSLVAKLSYLLDF